MRRNSTKLDWIKNISRLSIYMSTCPSPWSFDIYRLLIRSILKGILYTWLRSHLVGLGASSVIGVSTFSITPDKAAYCVFTLGSENTNKFISVRTKTQQKSLILNSELFHRVWRYSILFVIAIFAYNTSNCWVQIYTRPGAKSSILNCRDQARGRLGRSSLPNLAHFSQFSL